MRRLALWGVLCAATVAAQQIQIAGDPADNTESTRAADGADNMVVVTLPGPEMSVPATAVVVPPPALTAPDPAMPLRPAAPLNPGATGTAVPATVHSPANPFLPAEFARDSGIFCQKLIGAWTEPDAYNLFGAPLRRRPAYDAGGHVNGQIVGYSDPTGRYRLIELDFAQGSGLLRTVFVYPWKMNWQECRRMWGNKVQSTGANKGRTFYSYVNRRLDVLVDATGNVISLGLY